MHFVNHRSFNEFFFKKHLFDKSNWAPFSNTWDQLQGVSCKGYYFVNNTLLNLGVQKAFIRQLIFQNNKEGLKI
jgi:hypothetical protein